MPKSSKDNIPINLELVKPDLFLFMQHMFEVCKVAKRLRINVRFLDNVERYSHQVNLLRDKFPTVSLEEKV